VSDPLLVFLRLRHGLGGQSRRVVHVVAWPTADHAPTTVTAYCGEQIREGIAEQLDRLCGMPCVPCLLAAPLPATPDLPRGV
jgi:hypothetical protein